MTIRADIAELLRQGLSDRAIARQLHVDATWTVAPARAALGLPKTPRLGPTPAESLEAAFRARAQPVAGGHLLWVGHVHNGTPGFRWSGRFHTAYRVAFRLRTGREAKGKALPDCDYPGCVAPSHVDDAPGRARTAAALAAIFGTETPR